MKLIGISSSTTENRIVLNRSYHDAFCRDGVVSVALPILAAPNRETMTVDEYIGIHGARIKRIVDGVDGICISGGPDLAPQTFNESNWGSSNHDMTRDFMEIGLVRAAIAANKPIIGICKGFQVIGRVLGLPFFAQDLAACNVDELHNGAAREIKDRAEPIHSVNLYGDYLAYVRARTGRPDLETMLVSSYHHQGFLLGPISKEGVLGLPKGIPKHLDPLSVAFNALNQKGVKVLSATDLVLEGYEKEDIRCVAYQSHPEDIVNSLAISYWLDRYVFA